MNTTVHYYLAPSGEIVCTRGNRCAGYTIESALKQGTPSLVHGPNGETWMKLPEREANDLRAEFARELNITGLCNCEQSAEANAKAVK